MNLYNSNGAIHCVLRAKRCFCRDDNIISLRLFVFIRGEFKSAFTPLDRQSLHLMG